MEPLKEMFNKAFYQQFAAVFSKADKNFNPDSFVKEVTQNLEKRALNDRLRNTSVMLQKHLPADYKKAINILFKAAPNLKTGYTALVLPDFVGLYGHDHFDLSMEALQYFTRFGSSEFAIREFLKRDFAKTIKVMNRWAEDENHHVRRLASEGSRPRLPWSFKLDEVIKNPSVTKTILEKLKEDEELYVRKSVANHLNDISKENPAYMLQLVKSWNKNNKHTSWIIKHASRTLIKKGHEDSLSVFGFEKNVKVEMKNFKLNTSKLKLGEVLQFSFDLVSLKNKPQKLVVDYAIHYRKNAGTSRKVFKLREMELLPKENVHIVKRQVFKDFTTRKHYKGKHWVEVVVNGVSFGKKMFELV